MGKLLGLLLLVFTVNLGLALLLGVDVPGSALYSFLQEPSNWGNTDLMGFITDTLAVVGVGVIIVGTIWTKSDFIIFAGIAGVFLSFGKTLYNLFQIIASQPMFEGGGNIIAMMVVSPLILAYVYIVLEFWRGKD